MMQNFMGKGKQGDAHRKWFEDKLVKPLAEVLEAFDSEGGVLEKLKNSDLFKGIVETFEKIGEGIKEQFDTIGTDIKTAFEDAKTTFETMGETIVSMGDDVKKLMESVTLVSGYVKQVYDMINDYVMQFDTRGTRTMHPTEGVIETGDGKLDAFEMKNLKEDLEKKLANFVGTLVTNTIKALGLVFGAGLLYQFAKGAAFRAGLGGSPSGDGPPRRSARGSLVKNLAKSLVVGTSAFSSSVGQTTAAASLKPGQAINKAGSIYNTKTGQIVKPASAFSHLSKYPRLMMAARRIPILTPLLTGALAIDTMTNDELDKDEKITALGGILGGGLGAMGFGALGATLGTTFGPAGTVIGAILGSLTGFVGGEKLGQVLAGFLLGKERESIPLQSSSTLGEQQTPMPGGRGATPHSAPLTMDAQLQEADAAGFQRQALKQYRMSTMPSTSGATVSKLSNATKSNGDSSALPLSMPVLVDKGQVTNIQSNYGSRLNVDNGNSTSRLFTDSLLIDVRGSLAGGF